MAAAQHDPFDEAYYQRFYLDPQTRVVDTAHLERLGQLVASYVNYLQVPVLRVLDMGCGIGLWRDIVQRHFPAARYKGVEYSQYVCEQYGWEQGSVVDYRSPQPFDLVICQGVLPYLPQDQVLKALDNLGRLCQGALYLEAVAREDFERDIIDEDLTDGRQHRHPAALYRQGLAPHFKEMGGGLWLSRRHRYPLFALECASD